MCFFHLEVIVPKKKEKEKRKERSLNFYKEGSEGRKEHDRNELHLDVSDGELTYVEYNYLTVLVLRVTS